MYGWMDGTDVMYVCYVCVYALNVLNVLMLGSCWLRSPLMPSSRWHDGRTNSQIKYPFHRMRSMMVVMLFVIFARSCQHLCDHRCSYHSIHISSGKQQTQHNHRDQAHISQRACNVPCHAMPCYVMYFDCRCCLILFILYIFFFRLSWYP